MAERFQVVGQYDIIRYVDTSFIEMFLWKRSGALFPKLIKFEVVRPEKVIVDRVEKEKTSYYKP